MAEGGAEMAISSSLVALGTTIGIFALLAIGMNIKFGYTGLLEIGHVAFYLLGAYVTALLVLRPAGQNPGQIYILGLNWPWIPAIIGGVIVAAVIGALVALPAIRLREDYLAITLLGMAFIVQQIFRSERWLANGPRALAGFERPLTDLFPLPGEGLLSVITFGIILFILWTAGTYAMAAIGDIRSAQGLRERIVHLLLAVFSLGIGYLLARRARREGTSPNPRPAVFAGVVVGIVGMVLAFATPSALNDGVALVTLGVFSVFTWVLGGVLYTTYYSELTRRDHVYGVAASLAFLATFLPLVLFGKSSDPLLSIVALLLTGVLLAAFFYGLYRLAGRWTDYSDVSMIRIIGVAAVWLFLLRYWIISNLGVITQTNGVLVALGNTIQNLIWLLRFDQNLGVIFGYSRFFFVMVLLALAFAYYIAETTVTSPFGRVLKAVREDEDVATALGKNAFSYKVQSMALGSGIAALAGGLTAIQFQSLTWSIFRVEITFIVLLMVIIGGTANNRGAILGAAIYWGFARGTTDIAAFFPSAAGSSIIALRRVIIGALLIIILYYRPEGLWGEESGVSIE